MKFRTTQKAIREGYSNIIKIGYCNVQHLLSVKSPIAYTTRREGWGSDIYEITSNTCIVTGYAPFGNIKPDYNVTREYDEKARKIRYDYSLPWEEQEKKINALLIEFIKEVISK